MSHNRFKTRHKPFTVFYVLFTLLLTGCQTTLKSEIRNPPTKVNLPVYYIYLAGPEVFLPDPIGAGVAKKAKIDELNKKYDWPFTLTGLYPMDNEIKNFGHDFDTGIAIYKANIELMQKANFVTANMIRFRGPSMDVGTAFEMGYMRGLDKPVFAYYDAKPFYGQAEKSGTYKEKVKQYYPLSKEKQGTDAFGQSIEDFAMADNLMMVGAIEADNHKIADTFEDAVLQIVEHIKNQR